MLPRQATSCPRRLLPRQATSCRRRPRSRRRSRTPPTRESPSRSRRASPRPPSPASPKRRSSPAAARGMEPGRPPAEPPPSRPFAIAITGGIGAGKSEALRAFSRHGAATLSSDEIVHDLIRDDAEVRAQLVDRFGEGILAADGTPERARIAEIVFADRDELRWLERLLHPRVVGCYLAWRDELARRPEPPAVCAIEVPLLYEAGGEGRFDAVVAITAPAAVRH